MSCKNLIRAILVAILLCSCTGFQDTLGPPGAPSSGGRRSFTSVTTTGDIKAGGEIDGIYRAHKAETVINSLDDIDDCLDLTATGTAAYHSILPQNNTLDSWTTGDPDD